MKKASSQHWRVGLSEDEAGRCRLGAALREPCLHPAHPLRSGWGLVFLSGQRSPGPAARPTALPGEVEVGLAHSDISSLFLFSVLGHTCA